MYIVRFFTKPFSNYKIALRCMARAVSISVVAAAIVVAIIGGLSVGLVFVPSFSNVHGATTVTRTVVSFETVASTVIGGGAESPSTVLMTIPTTKTETFTQNQSVIQVQIVTQSATKYVTSFTNNYLTVTHFDTVTTNSNGTVAFYHNYHFQYPANQSDFTFQTFQFPQIGYIGITFQSAQNIHWQASLLQHY